MKRERWWAATLRGLLLPAVALAVLLAFFTALNGLQRDRAAVDQSRLEDTLRRAAAACYAAEGIYPPDISYLEERYGVRIDRDRYTVDYQVFASNLMPDITVLRNGTEGMGT